MSKRLFSSLVLVFVFALVLAAPLSAMIFPNPGLQQVQKGIQIEKVKEILEAKDSAQKNGEVSQDINTYNVYNQILGSIVVTTSVGDVGEDGVVSGGLIQTTSQLIADMYANPAASGQTYLADIFNSAGVIAQPAYAQGLGFSSLNPILTVWKSFRNIAYFFFVIVFIVIGFMIMFRQKISGQAVVTAQQAIPSIIIALLLVTFSYAIAGFLIDIMYLTMFLLVSIFQKDGATFIDGNFLQLGWTIVAGNFTSVGEEVGKFVNDSLGGGILSNLAGIISGLTVAVIFAVAIAIGMFRLFFNLLKRYITIILSVATAPLILMIGAIPGQNTFNPWLKGLIGNLAAFPILLLALIISDTITGNLSGTTVDTTQGGFMPPYLAGSSSGSTVTFLLGVGLLLILSELVDKGAQALGAGKGPFDDLTTAMFTNLRRGDEAIPLFTGGFGAAQGAVRGGVAAARNEDQNDPRGILRAMRQGYEVKDSHNQVVRTIGGAGPRVRTGLQLGQKIRSNIEDIEKGRFLRTDNLAKTLEDIRKNQQETSKPSTSKKTPEKRRG